MIVFNVSVWIIIDHAAWFVLIIIIKAIYKVKDMQC